MDTFERHMLSKKIHITLFPLKIGNLKRMIKIKRQLKERMRILMKDFQINNKADIIKFKTKLFTNMTISVN